VGLIFRSALPEDLEWDIRAEDVALSLDAIKRCLSNMLAALDRDTPQMKNGLSLPLTFSTQELMMTQEPPWLWLNWDSIAHGRVPQTNTPSDRGIYAKICFKRPRLGKGRRRGLLGVELY